MDPKKLDDINKGAKVQIRDERNGDLINITVDEILTKIPYHHNGILVKGINNEIGRVEEFCTQITEQDIINELIKNLEQDLEFDESETLEFKSNMLFDRDHYNRTNEKREFEKGTHSIAKTIAAFANQHGGVLYIGVSDQTREILGLEEDYKLLPQKKDSDGFLIKLKNSMENMLGRYDFHSCVKERRILKTCSNKEVCVIKVDPISKPLILKWKQQQQLYVREGSDSIPYENIQAFCNHWHKHMKWLELHLLKILPRLLSDGSSNHP